MSTTPRLGPTLDREWHRATSDRRRRRRRRRHGGGANKMAQTIGNYDPDANDRVGDTYKIPAYVSVASFLVFDNQAARLATGHTVITLPSACGLFSRPCSRAEQGGGGGGGGGGGRPAEGGRERGRAPERGGGGGGGGGGERRGEREGRGVRPQKEGGGGGGGGGEDYGIFMQLQDGLNTVMLSPHLVSSENLVLSCLVLSSCRHVGMLSCFLVVSCSCTFTARLARTRRPAATRRRPAHNTDASDRESVGCAIHRVLL
eukprot:COSAG06_NODE_1725_length_8579_cov_14.164151_3_plen_259_part_00